MLDLAIKVWKSVQPDVIWANGLKGTQSTLWKAFFHLPLQGNRLLSHAVKWRDSIVICHRTFTAIGQRTRKPYAVVTEKLDLKP